MLLRKHRYLLTLLCAPFKLSNGFISLCSYSIYLCKKKSTVFYKTKYWYLCKLYKNFVFAVSFCKLAKIICRIFAVCTLRHFIMRIYESAAQFFSFFAGLRAESMQFRPFFPLPSQTNAIARLKIMHFPLSLRSSARLFCCLNYALTESA